MDRDLKENELEEDDFQHDSSMLYEDPVASDDGARVLDANSPIKNPRLYFATIFDMRISSVLLEWQVLVRALECEVYDQVSLRGFPFIDCHS